MCALASCHTTPVWADSNVIAPREIDVSCCIPQVFVALLKSLIEAVTDTEARSLLPRSKLRNQGPGAGKSQHSKFSFSPPGPIPSSLSNHIRDWGSDRTIQRGEFVPKSYIKSPKQPMNDVTVNVRMKGHSAARSRSVSLQRETQKLQCAQSLPKFTVCHETMSRVSKSQYSMTSRFGQHDCSPRLLTVLNSVSLASNLPTDLRPSRQAFDKHCTKLGKKENALFKRFLAETYHFNSTQALQQASRIQIA